MLPEHLSELLTAYVDGELSPRKRKEVTKLLKKSAEARKLLQKLEEDSSFLRRLPRQQMRQDLSDSVLGNISMRGLKLPLRDPAAPTQQRIPVAAPAPKQPVPVAATPGSGIPWLGLLAFLLFLILVGIASYLVFSAG